MTTLEHIIQHCKCGEQDMSAPNGILLSRAMNCIVQRPLESLLYGLGVYYTTYMQ
ncbi:predicted protein [Plenodomus lingam JN3]|uniref:Predicted protein n=1 Tax=Leptosphaeria maculans (strain JN3 / isolate v23.1.3 / race Av1-4-5-6-7-8) TaxID=985895 RepID=E5AD40_LEPMJ|nr:predicted protein [Plenodomus lingam JN3]CBY02392.1 predicted protein [Plenodomus lingam JN3]